MYTFQVYQKSEKSEKRTHYDTQEIIFISHEVILDK